MIDLRIEKFSFADAGKKAGEGFTLIIRDFDPADLPADGQEFTLAEIPGAFTLIRRYAVRSDALNDYTSYWEHMKEQAVFDASQHYAAHALEDGSIPVIEGAVTLHDEAHPDWKEIRVGFPVKLIPPGKHELVLHCDGVRLHLILDQELADENFIYGKIDLSRKDELRSGYEDTSFSAPAILPDVTVKRRKIPGSLQFFSPPGYNAWVGDVVPFEHNGTVHMFYLHDRRHHASKFGTGAHYYGHYSSTDLINWTEHDFTGRIEHQWETCGTGTPFFHNGKYYFAYGLHTDRFIPYEENAGKLLQSEAAATGVVHCRTFEELGMCHPEGMTYAVSDDCFDFRKSLKLTHFSENPSVYTMPDNTLNMYADGLWKADQVDGPWTRLRSDFPPSFRDAAMGNTLECPSFFEWNNYYYMIVGMTGMYGADNAEFSDYKDIAAEGLDVYDGMIVPMVIPYKKDRRLISGWIFPFGTYFCMHELVQFPDKMLGSKWVSELYPEIKSKENIAENIENKKDLQKIDSVSSDSCYIFELENSHGAIAVQFLNEAGNGCEFQLDLDGKWAQYESVSNECFRPPLPTMRAVMENWRDKIAFFKELPSEIKYKCHVYSKDYRLDKLRGTDEKFTLRLMMKYDPKMPSTILDAEIAGVRTMLSLRDGLKVEQVAIAVKNGAKIRRITAERF